MPTFLGLPVEIQRLIISDIPLNDIENFTLCSKVAHQLSRKRLMEQYARKRHFSTIAVGHIGTSTWDEDPRVRGVHPILILRDLLADAQSWLYTKTLIIGYLEDINGQVFEDQEEAELDEIELQDVVAQFKLNTRLLKTVVEVQRRIYPERGEIDLEKCPKAKKWTQAILSGETEASASLLIAILPNVQKLRLVDDWKFQVHGSFTGTLHDLLKAAVSDKYDITGINSFSKLTEVGMHGAGQQCGANYDVFRGFVALPSMRTIKGRIIDGVGGGCGRYSSKCSKVESLAFYQSAIDASTVSGMLCAIRGLQSFAYDFWGDASVASVDPDDRAKWEPRQIVQALEIYTRKSLRHLELTSLLEHDRDGAGNFQNIESWRGEPFIGSLCTFEVLEKIRLETMMLYKEIEGDNRWTREEENAISRMQEGWEAIGENWARTRAPNSLVEPERLVDVLPASICRLRLVGGLSNEDATSMLENLPALKEERLPNLLSIVFEDVERSNIDENVVRKCEEAGVEMKFWRPSGRPVVRTI